MSKFKNVRTLVQAGLFVALGVVLQLPPFSITTPLARIGLSPVPIMLAGMILGPVVGGIVGLVKDLIGVLISGYPPFPWITLVQILYGVLPALLLRPLLNMPSGKWKVTGIMVGIGLIQFLNGTLNNTAALTLLRNGALTLPLFLANLTARIPAQLIHIAIYPVITYSLYAALRVYLINRGDKTFRVSENPRHS